MARGGEALFEIDLGENGGLFRFRTLKQFADWTRRERETWSWLTALPDGEKHGPVPSQSSQLAGVENWGNIIFSQGTLGNEDPQATLHGHYGGAQPRLYHSTGPTGTALLALREKLGDRKAALAYSLLVGHVEANLRRPDHLQVLTLVSNPTLIDRSAREAATRETIKGTLRHSEELAGEQSELLKASDQEWQSFKQRARQLGFQALRHARTANRRLRGQVATDTKAAIEAIEATDAAYSEHMQLQAAVQYWEDKGTTHATNRDNAFGHLWKFGAAAGAGAVVTFALAVIFMLEMSGADAVRFINGRAPTDPQLPAATYLVITAAVGTILTALFWISRVLLRMYLTERSLHADAEERRVMTKTYLALIKDGGALKDEDRLVILNALFRPARDGGGAPEGGGEVALPALIAKLMDQRQ